jgi:hypothetical protein
VFVTVEYDDETGHHTALGNGLIEIAAPQAALARYAWISAAVLMAAWITVRVYRRSGHSKSALHPAVDPKR